MKKIFVLTLSLFILSVSSLILVSVAINSNNDTIEITEKVLLGNRDFAKGITVLSKTHYGNQLYWNTEYTIGEGAKPETKYEFFQEVQTEKLVSRAYYFHIDTDIRYGCDFNTPAEEQVGLSRIYKELYDKCKAGERIVETIYLKDVYEYYPLRLKLSLPNVHWTNNDYENLYNDEIGEEKYVVNKFIEFFKIPVFEDHQTTIGIGKDVNGVSISSYEGNSPEDYDFYFSSVSTHTEDTVFFTIINKNTRGQYADFSLVPGGYGIYSFKYQATPLLYGTGIDADSLNNVYPLDKDLRVTQLEISKNGKHLIMLGIKNNDTVLNVIDIETMSLLSEIIIENKTSSTIKYKEEIFAGIASGEIKNESDTVKTTEDFIVIIFPEDFALIKTSEDGKYTLEFIAPKVNFVNKNYSPMDYGSKMVYDGGRFIIVDSLYSYELQTELCGYYVAIYNKTGLIYYAEYASSLDINNKAKQSSYNCRKTNKGYTILINEP